MTEEIYGDVLFIINFSMDFLALYIVGRLMHFQMKKWRVITGASLGAIYGVLELFFVVSKLLELASAIAVLFLMCLLAFGYEKARTYFASVALVGGVSMLIGGMMTAAFLKLGPYSSYIELGGDIHTVYGDLPVPLFAVFAGLSALATWMLGKLFRRKRAVRTCVLRIGFRGKEKELVGLVDSGNLAEEPISGMPVVFLKKRASEILPENLLYAMETGASALSADDAGTLRVIPTRTVSGGGLLLAAVPERFLISRDGVWESRRVLVAVDFSEGDFGGFDVLVPEILFC